MIGLKNSHLFLDQSEVKPKPITSKTNSDFTCDVHASCVLLSVRYVLFTLFSFNKYIDFKLRIEPSYINTIETVPSYCLSKPGEFIKCKFSFSFIYRYNPFLYIPMYFIFLFSPFCCCYCTYSFTVRCVE